MPAFLNTVISTSEGMIGLLLLGIVWVLFGYFQNEMNFQQASEYLGQIAMVWIGGRSAVKAAREVNSPSEIMQELKALVDEAKARERGG